MDFYLFIIIYSYSKCPKVLYTKVSDKMAYANSADPDQSASEGAVWSGSTVFVIQLSINKFLLQKNRKKFEESVQAFRAFIVLPYWTGYTSVCFDAFSCQSVMLMK